ncbi:MAG: hypothetical protein J6Y02_17645 [Pseudobutyrivibrio sp.]|nr:hypothetical protein [Pseudobutyrivibrio sp.]
MKYDYIEIAEIEIHDKYYSEQICEALQEKGYHTALIYNGITNQKIRILEKSEKKYE